MNKTNNFASIYIRAHREVYNQIPLISLCWLVNWILASISSNPLYKLINRYAGDTLLGRELLDKMDLMIWSEITSGKHSIEYLQQLSFLFFISIIIYFIFNLFWKGGVLNNILHNKEDNYLNRFKDGGICYFWRLVRLMLLRGFFYLGIFVLWISMMTLSTNIMFNQSKEIYAIIIVCASTIICGLLIIFIKMLFDYPEVLVVLDNRRSILLACIDSWRYVIKKRFWSIITLHYLIQLEFFIVIVIGSLLYILLMQNSQLIYGNIIKQLFTLLSINFMIISYAGSGIYTNILRPEAHWLD